jgi:hypothetical protein
MGILTGRFKDWMLGIFKFSRAKLFYIEHAVYYAKSLEG